MRYNVAIDGPAGAGKTTIAKEVSKRLSLLYVDTGAMYRTVGLYYYQNNLDIHDEKIINAYIGMINIKIDYVDGMQRIYLNDNDVTDLIRNQTISEYASIVSTYHKVRSKLDVIQKDLVNSYDVLMEGRDIGVAIIPNAFLKVYLTASTSARALRRFKELEDKDKAISLEIIEKEIIERDYRDTHRDNSPLRQADDAIVVDTSNMTIEEVINHIINLYNKKIGELNEKDD